MFDLTKMSPDEAKNAIALLNQAYNANIALQQQGSTQEVNEILLDLSVERPRHNALEISFPFISMHVDQASDANTQVNALLNTRDDFQKSITLTINDTVTIERGVRKVYLYWTAQASKSMLIKFFTTAKMDSGTLVLAQVSNPPLESVGEASAPLDGFTQILTTSLVAAMPASSTALLNVLDSQNDNTYNNGVFNCPTSLGGHFQVPKGYTAEVVGGEMEVSTAIGSTAYEIALCEVDYNQTFANVAALASAGRGICNISGANYAVTTTPLKRPVGRNVFGIASMNRATRTFGSEKLIIPVVTNFTATTTGAFTLRILVRLTKNVGA